MFYHVRNDSIQKWAGAIQAWVGVDLNQPRLEVPINHEIQPKYLEIVHLVLRTDLIIYTSGCVFAHFLHLGQDFFLEIVLPIRKRVEIILKLCIRYLIVGLISAILRVVLLDGVVCEVDFWLEVVDVEEVRGSADVAFLIPVSTCHSVDICDEEVVSDVEFAVVVEKRTIDVHLYYEGLFL